MALSLDFAELATELSAAELADFLRECADRCVSDGAAMRGNAHVDALRALADVVERATVVHSTLSDCPACHAAAGAACYPSCELGAGMGA